MDRRESVSSMGLADWPHRPEHTLLTDSAGLSKIQSSTPDILSARTSVTLCDKSVIRRPSIGANEERDVGADEEKHIGESKRGVEGHGGGGHDGDGHDGLESVTKLQQRYAVLSAFLTNMVVLGSVQAFGILQRHYGSDAAVRDGVLPENDSNARATISAIGALGNGGIVSALCAVWYIPIIPLLGRKVKLLCFVGTFLMSLGWATAAASTKLSHLLATQGLVSGIGAGILFNTLPVILPEYFDGHSGWAQGIAAAGSGIGGLVFSLLLNALLRKLHSREAFGVFAVIFFVFGSIASLAAQPARRIRKRKTTAAGWSAFKEPKFLLFMIFNLLTSMTFRDPMTFGPDFSRMLGYNTDQASYLLAAISGTGIVARPILGWVADKMGHQNSLILSMGLYALSCFTIWLSAATYSNRAFWIVFILICGTLNGAFLQLSTSVAQRVFGNELYYCYSGAFMAIRGVGFVIGNPIAGALVKHIPDGKLKGPDFLPLITLTGAALTIATFCLIAVRWLDAKGGRWS